MDEADKGADIIPFRIIEGGGQPLPKDPGKPAEQRAIPPQLAIGIAQLNAHSNKMLMQIGLAEVQLLQVAANKIKLYNEYRSLQKELMGAAEKAAREVGIDPNDNSKTWTVDLKNKVFIRTN